MQRDTKKELIRKTVNLVFRTRSFNNRCIKKFAQNIHGKSILELGSGKKLDGGYPYSAKQFFDKSNLFIQSDVVPAYGHRVIDVTDMDFHEEYDVIMCMNVLEHVFEFRRGIDNIHRALKKGGVIILFTPVMYPLHDEPGDFWRFTEHALRRLLSKFRDVRIMQQGIRQYPFAYYIEAVK